MNIIVPPTSTTFNQRMQLALPHEKETGTRIETCGWQVEPFGQAQCSAMLRAALSKVDTPFRWLPDLVAFRVDGGRTRLRLIDAKSSVNRDTPNYSFEKSSVDTAAICSGCFHIRTIFVTFDFMVVTPDAIFRHGVYRDGRNTRGSGTPFWLLPKTQAWELEKELSL